MNSFPFISHHLFVSAAGHEKTAHVKAARNQGEIRGGDSPRAARKVAPESAAAPEGPRQLDLLAGMAGAG